MRPCRTRLGGEAATITTRSIVNSIEIIAIPIGPIRGSGDSRGFPGSLYPYLVAADAWHLRGAEFQQFAGSRV